MNTSINFDRNTFQPTGSSRVAGQPTSVVTPTLHKTIDAFSPGEPVTELIRPDHFRGLVGAKDVLPVGDGKALELMSSSLVLSPDLQLVVFETMDPETSTIVDATKPSPSQTVDGNLLLSYAAVKERHAVYGYPVRQRIESVVLSTDAPVGGPFDSTEPDTIAY